jgi:hypothetical protein
VFELFVKCYDVTKQNNFIYETQLYTVLIVI